MRARPGRRAAGRWRGRGTRPDTSTGRALGPSSRTGLSGKPGSLDGVTAIAPRPDRAILPHALRAPAAAVSVLALLVFGVFADRYADDSTAGRLDRRVQGIVDHGPSLPQALINFGSPAAVVVLAALLAGLAFALGHRRLAVLAIVGP